MGWGDRGGRADSTMKNCPHAAADHGNHVARHVCLNLPHPPPRKDNNEATPTRPSRFLFPQAMVLNRHEKLFDILVDIECLFVCNFIWCL